MTTPLARPIVSRRHHEEVPPGRLWFGVLAAPAAWIAQGGLGWWFGSRLCTSMSIGTVRAVVGGISILAIAVALAGLMTGWRNWQRSAGASGLQAVDRVAFMSLGGILVSASFVAGTIWAGLTPVILGSCGGMR